MKSKIKFAVSVILSVVIISHSLIGSAQVKAGFDIEGKVKGLKNGEMLFLMIKRAGKIDTVSKTVAKNESFKLKDVKLPIYPDFYLLSIQTEFVDNLKLFLDQSDDVKINGNLKSWPSLSVIGSKSHWEYSEAERIRKRVFDKDFALKYPTKIASRDSVLHYSRKGIQEVVKEMPGSIYLPTMIVNWTYSSSNIPAPIEMKKEFYEFLNIEQKLSSYGQILEKQIIQHSFKEKCITQLKNAARSLTSISPEDVLQQLKSNSSGKVELKDLGQFSTTLTDVQITDELKESTIIMNMARKRGDQFQINPASGYVIDEGGICVTNYHVGKEYSSKPYSSLSVMTIDGKSYPVTKILSSSECDDLMIFQIDTRGDRLKALPLGKSVPRNSSIRIMGHPKGNFYSCSSGMISSYSTSTLAGQSCQIMSITADFNIGSSGGPIIDDFGNLVGTVSRIERGMKIGIPVNELKKLLILK